MVKYTCEKCGRDFQQKGHYTRHINKTTPCIQESKLNSIIEEKVSNAIQQNNPEYKKKMGQYFTISDALQAYVFDKVKHKGSLLMEPSFGAGHLLKKFMAFNPNYPMFCYELDNTIKPVVDFTGEQTVVYGDFTKQVFTRKFKTIVGNPPYVKQSTGNLYIKFIELCFNLLDTGGELLFIVPSDFIKLTSASTLIETMTKEGSFTHFLFPHDERLFEGASIDVLVFRYEKGLHSNTCFVNDKECHYNVSNGIITFSDSQKVGSPLEDKFNVYVGLVSGRDEIYKVPFGNLSVLNDKGKVDTYVFAKTFPTGTKEIDDHLRANKPKLLERKIKKFSESNWFEWGAPRNKKSMEASMGQPCIYVRNMTRNKEVAFLDKVQYFGGTLLCLIPKTSMTSQELESIVKQLNSSDFQKDYLYSGRFKIGHKQVSNVMLS